MTPMEASTDVVDIWNEPSRDARKRQDVGLTGFKSSETFINLYWILSQDIQLGAYYLDNFKVYDPYIHGATNTIYGTEYLFYGQYFIGNSFNIMAGVGQRRVWVQLTSDEPSTKAEDQCTIRGKANIASLGVGNQWTFGYFVVGIRWFALIKAVGRPKMENDCQYNYSSDWEESIEDQEERVQELSLSTSKPIIFFGVQF